MKKTACLILLMFLSTYQALAQVADNNFKIVATLKDKSGKAYEVREKYDLTKSAINYSYDFGPKENDNQQYRNLFSGKTYTDSETCPSSKLLEKYTIADKAILKHSFARKDFNGDHVQDFNLSIVEQDCKTSKLTFTEIFVYSTDTGFEIKQFQHEGSL
jgi:hypothetical protein